MLKVFASLVVAYGVVITGIPWLISPDGNTATNMIVSGLGLLTIGSGIYMWSKACSNAPSGPDSL